MSKNLINVRHWCDVQRCVEIDSLAVFRILFGLVMTAAMMRFIAHGWVDELLVQPRFHFTYPGFEWVRVMPRAWMHACAVATALAAFGVALGLYYRVSAALFFLGFTYFELIDQTIYLNHYYLVSLVAGLMVFLPAQRAWSWDVRRDPALRAERIPGWCLYLLRFQFAVVYVFAGIAKLNADWLLEAQPMRIWLAARSDLPWVGPWLEKSWIAYAAAWAGAIYDLSVPFLLLCRRTRGVAFAAVIGFHVLTSILFPSIGMFPWLMVCGACLFFPPGWPRRWIAPPVPPSRAARPVRAAMPGGIQFLLGLYVAAQVLIPLRGWCMHGVSAWTNHGFNWAWKVMIVEKHGCVEFTVRDAASGRRWRIDPLEHLTPLQRRMMAQDPHLIRQFAQYLARIYQAEGKQVAVYADAFATLNARPSQRLIDPQVDLAGELKDGWILPL